MASVLYCDRGLLTDLIMLFTHPASSSASGSIFLIRPQLFFLRCARQAWAMRSASSPSLLMSGREVGEAHSFLHASVDSVTVLQFLVDPRRRQCQTT
jgi:hypothetical protein